MMGPDAESRYDRGGGGFATVLEKKLSTIKPYIIHMCNSRLEEVNPRSEQENIKKAYDILSSGGIDGLNQRGGDFHVGATKVLHFLNPETFIIVDSNAARAFRHAHHVNFRNSTQPGYSSEKYIDCMEYAKMDILNYGILEFRGLDKGVPIARIYDKLTFMTGSSLR
jgi:hypothetical protein